MKQWYVKDLSKLTGVSVQTLHHYDRIDLLKPSFRTESGYRVYSEDDLLKLQQILALKYFGFELAQIKTLLAGDASSLEHFSLQAKFLDEKAQALQSTSKVLNAIITDMQDNKSINWQIILDLIEVYRMTQELEKSWAGQVLTADELKMYAQHLQELQDKFESEPGSRDAFLKKRTELIEMVNDNLSKDPVSEIGFQIAEAWMTTINPLYGPDKAELKKSLWEKGHVKNKVDDERALDPEIVQWLDPAIKHYYTTQIESVLSKILDPTQPYPELQKQWKVVMFDLCGNSVKLKQDFYDGMMADDQTSEAAKQWLKKHWKF